MAKRAKKLPKIGGKYPTWFSGQEDGLSTIMKIEPYRGRYTEWFKYTLTLTAPNVYKGCLEMAVSESNLLLYARG